MKQFLSNINFRQLSKGEMKKIQGGVFCICQCQDHTGELQGNFSDINAAMSTMSQYCRGSYGCSCERPQQQ